MKLRLTAKVESKASIDQFVTLEKNMPKANFWVVCSGDFAGMPTKEFKPEHIGVKVAWLPFLSANWQLNIFKFQLFLVTCPIEPPVCRSICRPICLNWGQHSN